MYVDYLTVGPEALAIERRQLAATGRLTEEVATDLDALREDLSRDDVDPTTPAHRQRARSLLDRCASLPDPRDDEPDGLDAIHAARPPGPRTLPVRDDARDHRDHLAGAWAGRVAGCFLGKPVETWTRERIEAFLDATGQSLDGYLRADLAGSDGFDLDATGGWVDRDERVRDDDIDFTVAALETLRRVGSSVTTEDLARTWLTQLPAGALHTAERVAYRNLLDGVDPPETATSRNPYRELIGAQIRGDCYGYVAPGAPEKAAALAHRDARLSHVRNGLYGAMWVAATLAAVPATESVCDALNVGLTEVPADSRFAAAVETVLSWCDAGIAYETALARVHDAWDDADFYEGYHVLPNAQVVAAVLAWESASGPDLSRALARAVRAGFDTDCNAATVGSVLGCALGRDVVASTWTDRFEEGVPTALAGRPCPTIDWLATETAAVADRLG
ncbi:ADP-ribosylglycohydrolase family protein [Salinigranum rubrum]|uniref:ADP-ribosylglycohydrolase family protein n=1 Tax=Salinigranum rubrum TaxID=755307 RepID=UPI0013A54C73|nr:ADP-ribosylglycohydrolase family protein [Salinigranum rubrum]